MTTPETLTDRQIRTLRHEAHEHGDDLMVMICEIALADALTDSLDPGALRADLERLRIIPEHIDSSDRARAECARVIAAAAAQSA